MVNPFKRRHAFRDSIPDQDTRMKELDDIFGPVPKGGDVVVEPDGPPPGAQFTRAEVERIAKLGYEAVLSGEWEETYRQICEEVRAEEQA